MKALGLLLLFFLIPEIAYSATSALLMPPGTDKSLEYLGNIFGAVGNLPLGTGGALFSAMSQVLNQVILVIAFIIVGYTTLVSVINTAHQGEVMGKKWSIIWIPVRIASGIFLLMPSSTGYAYIQIFVMWFIVNGIGLADKLWDQVIADTIAINTSITVTAPPAHSVSTNAASTAGGILTSKMCLDFFNTADHGLTLKENLTLYRDGELIGWGYATTREPICGSIIIPKFTSFLQNAYSDLLDTDTAAEEENNNALFFNSILAIDTLLDNAALEALELPSDQWGESTLLNIKEAAALVDDIIVSISTVDVDNADFSGISENASKDGWIHAGSYYFHLVAGATYKTTLPKITITYNKMDFEDEFGDIAKSHETNIRTKANNYLVAAHDMLHEPLGPERNTITEGYDGSTSSGLDKNEVAGVFTEMFGSFFIDIALGIIESMHNNAHGPIVAMGIAGSTIVLICEILIFTAAVGVGILQLGAAWLSCMNPMASTVKFVTYTVVPLYLGVLLACWSGGMGLALYVPLIPYLVFTFSAFAWFFLVIEAMVAAPLIALGLIVPSEDEVGRAATGGMLLMNIFLRPGLMIIGFALASKLLIIASGMLNFGFEFILLTQITGIGIFGSVAIVVLYCGLALTVVHECFSLIHILPDKVITWISGQAESSKVMDNVKQAKGYTEKGSQAGGSMMKGLTPKDDKK